MHQDDHCEKHGIQGMGIRGLTASSSSLTGGARRQMGRIPLALSYPVPTSPLEPLVSNQFHRLFRGEKEPGKKGK